MGLFSKKRHGQMTPVDNDGRRFTWRLENFSKYKSGSTLDSDTVMCFTKVKFHFHMALGVNGDVGLYVHYKSTCIPKYSYFFSNTSGVVMRQHTAHTIPSNTERCGHWNACYYPDLTQFVSKDDVVLLNFVFDDDSLTIQRLPQQNTVSVLWTVPHLFQQILNPYSSKGFTTDRSLLVLRLDIKKEAGANDANGAYDVQSIKDIVLFVFCRKGNVPPHSIQLMDAESNPIVRIEKKDNSGSNPLIVSKERVLNAIGMDGALHVGVEFHCGGNPLEALNMLSGLQQQQGFGQPQDAEEMDPNTRTVKLGENNEEYHAMNGDD